MFTKNKDSESAAVQPQPAKRASRTSVPSIISGDLTVVGTLISSGDVQVDGRVEGDIRATALVIGEDASIQGDVYAEEAIIRGRVEGGIQARKVQLCATSHVEGNILHEALSVEAGAFFEGNCRHSDNPLQDADKLNAQIRSAAQSSKPAPVASAPSSNGSGSAATSEPHAAVAGSPVRPAASFTPIKN